MSHDEEIIIRLLTDILVTNQDEKRLLQLLLADQIATNQLLQTIVNNTNPPHNVTNGFIRQIK